LEAAVVGAAVVGAAASRRRGVAGASLIAVCVRAATAGAAPSQDDLAAARGLFAEAVKDEDAGRWPDALQKMQRVAGVRLTSGVRYHLALCEENLGHLVAALDGFSAARAQAATDGAQDVLRLVGKRLEELEPRVPRLTVQVVPADAGATVTLDDWILPPSMLGAPTPVDPGPHRVVASAPGRASARATLELREHDVTSIDLALPEAPPAPASAHAPTPTPVPAPARAPAASNPHLAALWFTGGAIALAGAGAAAFVLAGSAAGSGAQQCATQTTPCDSAKNTVRAWDFAAAGAWLGAAALGAYAVVLWTRPGPAPRPAASLLVGPGAVGVEGRF
jgi:hypothetical protein